jgi:YesN/AraC family two-component response regulator
LLGGKITVESIAGKGSCFSVHLPVTNNAPFIASDSEDEINNVSGLETSHCRIENTPKEKTDFSTLPLLLIVEDSTDVSQYLAAILKSEYQIIRAENGREGLEKTLETVPDIILSDVMMPVMDGIEFLDSVKKDFRTSHIPVVMLTAKADIDSRIEGLERGADAYLSKPFNEKELHVILHNLIEIRKILHNRYASPDKLPETPEVEFKLEDEFMLKVKHLLEANYEDDEFGIQQICSELALSRTQLYRKFKSVSNKTIAEYFKIIKLNKARDLLLNSKLNITQVAFSTGFKNLSHFSREFSAWFGKSPNEFRKK